HPQFAGKRITRVAENAAPRLARTDEAERQRRGMESLCAQLVDNRRHFGGMRDRRMWIRSASRFGRIDSAFSVNLIQALGLIVVRLQRVVINRPARRQTAEMFHVLEVFSPKAEQDAPPELAVAADAVVDRRIELASLAVQPPLRGPVTPIFP